ncbi:MAG TPA: ADP-ribosylglycohydrolase family protein [Marmoricola sp.]|nr:ADP-ribosylglycohydrolase family protein [Marmoricola sp.]
MTGDSMGGQAGSRAYLSAAQVDRAAGVLLGAAVGDALGAGYEFGVARLGVNDHPAMIGGGLGGFAPGEWTDDTAQTWAVAEVAASGADLRTEAALDAVARRIAEWFAGNPPDVGNQTAAVLRAAGRSPSAAALREAATGLHRRTGHTAGNGSLMRTSAVALAHLGDPEAIVAAAHAVSALTHADARAGEACALWCLAIDHAVRHGELDVRAGLGWLPAEAREFWQARLDEAEARDPATFTPNGYVVTALQAAWSAIHHTPVPCAPFTCVQVGDALSTAIHIGNDTDTIASIAGALLGARWGASAFPAEWRRVVHGWPGRTSEQLVDLALLTVNGGPDRQGWPGCARVDYTGMAGHDSFAVHPHDKGVLLSGAASLDALPDGVTAVVSLCRVGVGQVPAGVKAVSFRLMDTDAADNPNLTFVLDDAARTVKALREDGATVLLHCVAAHSRTPTVAARYSMLLGVPLDRALEDVCAALPAARPNPALVQGLRALADHARMGAGDE